MIFRFHFEGNTPSKKNQKRILKGKGGRPFIASSSEHERWHKAAAVLMAFQRSRHTGARFPLPRCEKVIVKLFYEDRRRRDASNTLESIMDLLVDAQVLADDSWAVVGPMGIFPSLRAGAPGWEVLIYTAEPAPGPSEVHNFVMEAKP